jgi:hypothetical protein
MGRDRNISPLIFVFKEVKVYGFYVNKNGNILGMDKKIELVL